MFGLAPLALLVLSQSHQDPGARAASDVLKRVFPTVASHFHFKTTGDPAAKPHFEVTALQGEVTVTGNSGVAMCRGAYDYLRAVGGAQASWGGTTLSIPQGLTDLHLTIDCPYRWVLQDNVCTFGYTTAFYGWKEWQHYLDVMALHGVNMEFSLVGSEAIWSTVWKSFGLGQKDLDAFFTGPAFLPWHRMGNVNGHDGPIPQSYLAGSVRLEKRILGQMRALGIQPVAPGFAGFVPPGFDKRFPQEKVLHVASWAGFQDPYRTNILHPLSQMYSQIGARFIREWKRTFGETHYFLADSFNELQVPVSPERDKRLDELALFGKSVYDGIHTGDPDGTWVMQGWLFFSGRQFWDQESAKALLSRVPDDRMIILDLFAESEPIWKSQGAFYGKQWILSNITTWGGNNQPYGNFKAYSKLSAETLTAPNHGNLVGFGISFEGAESNEVQFEQLCDSAWQTNPLPLGDIMALGISKDRYGSPNPDSEAAWVYFANSAYDGPFGLHPYHLIQERPFDIGPKALTGKPLGDADDSPTFEKGVASLLAARTAFKDNPLYRADLCQFVAHRALSAAGRMLGEAVAAQDAGLTDISKQREALFVELASDADRLLQSHPIDRLDRWVGQARRWGVNDMDRNYYEADAKRQVTVWGGPILTEYAAKVWSGLIADYYVPRWTQWLDARRDGRAFDVLAWEEKWIKTPSAAKRATPLDPIQEAVALIRKVKILPSNDFAKDLLGTAIAEWKSGESGTTLTERTWDITPAVTRTGALKVRFQYTSGNHRLEIEKVELLADGAVIAADTHSGRTGLEDVDNTYALKIADLHPGARYVLRARVRSDGGTDSNGTIFGIYSAAR